MSTKKIFLHSALLLLLVGGCADKDSLLVGEAPTTNISHPVTRSVDDALSIADKLFMALEEKDTPTRDPSRRVAKIDCMLSGTRTRSNFADTLLYIINYADNQGFALIGGPKDSEGVYAFSESGNFNIADTVNNKALASYLKLVENDIVTSITLPNPGPIGGDLIFFYHIISRVNPMLNINIAAWNQDPPYNNDAPVIQGKKGVAGCGPVALGMLCAYYKYPSTINGRKIDWNAVYQLPDKNSTASNPVSRLLEDLAGSKYLNCGYESYNNRVTFPAQIELALKALGYGNLESWYNVELVPNRAELLTFLLNKSPYGQAAPVMVGGSSGGVNGHIWIVDGIIEVKKSPFQDIGMGYLSEADPYIHCVWGWNQNNGYYKLNLSTGKLDNDGREGEHIDHIFGDLKMWGRFRF